MPRKLVSFNEAKKILKQKFLAKPIGIEYISLSEAHGRILSKDVIAHIDVPPFNRATVDGYAVKAKDTFGADETTPVTLKICGRINIGEASSITVENGSVAEIATGAPIPEGADAVVMIEYTTREDSKVLIYRPVSKDENVMKTGSDIKKGEKILKKRQKLSSWKIGILAALGLAEIEVYKCPKIAILSTGPEIIEL